jgi:hypothetical protein
MQRFLSIVRLSVILLAVGHAVWPTAVAADEPATAAVQETREQRVVAFVKAHQPDLAKVLAHLEKRKPAEYARAIEELDRSVQPLTSGKTKDPQLYDLELRAWQARTRVELLGAKLMAVKDGKARDRDELETQLREAIAKELDVKAEQLAYRKQRSAAWYDRQINRLSEKRDSLIAARLKSLLD